MNSGKALRLWIVGLVVAMFAICELGPSLVVAQERIEVAQVKKRRTLMDLLFGEPEPQMAPAPPVEQQAPPKKKKKSAPVEEASLPPAKPAVEKAPGATRVAVFGDSLAVDLGKALERHYAEDPNLVVLQQGVGSSGFVRQDYFDWSKAVGEQIAANSFDVAVMIIGINDRQTITVDGVSHKALTEGWNAIYTQRMNAVLNQLRAAGKPTIWVGLPPMEAPSYSTAMNQISAVQRLASFSGGAEFLDIYERFADENGKYIAYGPDLSGKSVQMRKADGIHFSSAGADKLAFFVSQSIKSFYTGAGVGVQVADPLLGTDAQTMMRPPYQGVGQIRQLEVAGAVISLSRNPARAGDLLTADVPPPAQDFDLEQLLAAPVGRVDAFGVGIAPDAPEPAATPAPAATPGPAATLAPGATPAATPQPPVPPAAALTPPPANVLAPGAAPAPALVP